MLVKLELTKFFKRPSTFIMPVIVILIALAVTGVNVMAESLTPSDMINSEIMTTAGTVSSMMIMGVAGRIITQEYTFGTMKVLLAQRFNRRQIFGAKMLVIAVMFVMMQVAIVMAQLLSSLIYYQKLLIDWPGVVTTFIDSALYTLLFVGLIVLLSNLLRNDLVAVIIAVVLTMSLQMIGAMIIGFADSVPALLFSPFAFYVGSRLVAEPQVLQAMHMSVPFVLVGTLVYSVIFYGLGYWLFARRDA